MVRTWKSVEERFVYCAIVKIQPVLVAHYVVIIPTIKGKQAENINNIPLSERATVMTICGLGAKIGLFDIYTTIR